MTESLVGRQVILTGDGWNGGTPEILVGSVVTLNNDRGARSWMDDHYSFTTPDGVLCYVVLPGEEVTFEEEHMWDAELVPLEPKPSLRTLLDEFERYVQNNEYGLTISKREEILRHYSPAEHIAEPTIEDI